MKKLLALAAMGEVAAGLLLLGYPSLVVKLLFGSEIPGAGIFLSRTLGISLIALGIACWPGDNPRSAFYGLLTYSTLVMLYFAYVGAIGAGGILLWPAIAFHAGLSIFLVLAWRKHQRFSPDH